MTTSGIRIRAPATIQSPSERPRARLDARETGLEGGAFVALEVVRVGALDRLERVRADENHFVLRCGAVLLLRPGVARDRFVCVQLFNLHGTGPGVVNDEEVTNRVHGS